MSLLPLLAPLVALSSVLPISSGAHAVIVEPWVGRSGASAMTSLGHLVAFLALAFGARHVAARALEDLRRGRRGPTSLALPIGLMLGLAGAELLGGMTQLVRSSPLSVGLGLAMTATMLATVGVAPDSAARARGLRPSLIVGALLSLSGLPAGSAIASAIVALRWTGRPLRASVPLAMALAAPFELRAAVGLADLAPAVDLVPLAVATACSVVAAALGAWLLTHDARRVVRTAGLYLAILAVAELGYAFSRIS